MNLDNGIAIELKRGERVFVDRKDANMVMSGAWKADKRGFIITKRTLNKEQRTVYLHRVITNAGDGEQVDHKSHSRADNRTANIRKCSNGQNRANTRLSKSNKSGFKGVYQGSTKKGKTYFSAGLGVDKVYTCLGRFDNAVDAARAYDAAAIKQYGEFALTNQALGLFGDLPVQRGLPEPEITLLPWPEKVKVKPSRAFSFAEAKAASDKALANMQVALEAEFGQAA